MNSLLRQLDRLIEALPFPPRLLRFCVVGGSGVVVNFLVLALALVLLPAWPARHRVAMALAIVVSIFSNFLLNDAWTWRDRRRAGLAAWIGRMLRFYAVSLVAALVQWGVAVGLYEGLALEVVLGWVAVYLAQGGGIGVALVINFAANHLWTFRRDRPAPEARQPLTNNDG